ncbi:DUF3237 family protein [Salinisphaera sp. RV14]|uniref:DUF3237 family protein n=1 Tax=unclassified Salinisphaera TaxID=2649847 RepID=UPI003F85AC91
MTDSVPVSPVLTYVCRLEVDIGVPMDFGVNPQGRRRFVPISGGRVVGPYLNGRILPGGGDWQTVRNDGVVDLRAQYAIELTDGTLVEMDNFGLRYVDADARPGPGESTAYFQTSARLNVAAGPYEWLMRTLFVAGAERCAGQVTVELFAVGNFFT